MYSSSWSHLDPFFYKSLQDSDSTQCLTPPKHFQNRYSITPNKFCHPLLNPLINLSYLRRFSFSDRIFNFEEEFQIENEQINYRKPNEDLLQQYLVEEEKDCADNEHIERVSFLEEEENKQMMTPIPVNPIQSINFEENAEKSDKMFEEKNRVLINNNNSKEENKDDTSNKFFLTETVKKEKSEVASPQVSDFICNCKKSKCLKLYCECFAKGKLCNSLCNCFDCCNKQESCKQRKMALRNTYLKSRKNEKDAQEVLEMDLDSFVLPNCNTRNLGCNCKKSHCKKKYCECFDAGRACGEHCKCEGCRNYLGAKIRRKDKGHRNNMENNMNHANFGQNNKNWRSKQKNMKLESSKEQIKVGEPMEQEKNC